MQRRQGCAHQKAIYSPLSTRERVGGTPWVRVPFERAELRGEGATRLRVVGVS